MGPGSGSITADTHTFRVFCFAVTYGSADPGFADGECDVAQFATPYALCLLVDPSHGQTDWLLCADSDNNRIHYSDRKLFAINIASGEVEDIATGDFTLIEPRGMAFSESDRVLFVSNRDSHQIIGVDIPDRYCQRSRSGSLRSCQNRTPPAAQH